MKYGIIIGAIASLMLCTCAPNVSSPLSLTIIRPVDGDTVNTLVNPVEGKTTPGARVDIGFDQNSVAATLVPDDTGLFVGTYTIPMDESGSYSLYITVSFQGKSIVETRTVTYQRLP